MTFKHLIRRLRERHRSESSRLKRLKRYDLTLRMQGRLEGLAIAIRLAERMREERLGV